MGRGLGAALVLLVGLMRPAYAQEGLFLSWNECALGAAASSSLLSACSTDFGEQRLFAAFRLATAVDSVVALEITVDVQHQSATLPAWWRFDPTACRDGALTADADFSGHADCVDFWGGLATEDPPVVYYVGQPRGGLNQGRMVIAIAVTPPATRRLEAGPMYHAGMFVISNQSTSTCIGCASGACLVLNSILVGRASGDFFLVTAPGPLDANWATWQGGGAPECAAVPVRRRSWGQLKSLYR